MYVTGEPNVSYVTGEPSVSYVMSLLTSHSIIGKPLTELIADNEED